MESVIITTFLRPLLKIEDIFGTGKTEDTTSPSDLKQVKFLSPLGGITLFTITSV